MTRLVRARIRVRVKVGVEVWVRIRVRVRARVRGRVRVKVRGRHSKRVGLDAPAKMASANCSAVMSPGCRPVYAGRNLVRARLGVRVRVRVRVRVYAGENLWKGTRASRWHYLLRTPDLTTNLWKETKASSGLRAT